MPQLAGALVTRDHEAGRQHSRPPLPCQHCGSLRAEDDKAGPADRQRLRGQERALRETRDALQALQQKERHVVLLAAKRAPPLTRPSLACQVLSAAAPPV